MKLTLAVDSRSFVVLEASTTTATRALAILGAYRFTWAVVQLEQQFYTFYGVELKKLLEKSRPSAVLSDALKLGKRVPSHVVGRKDAIVTLEALPPGGSTESRALVARKDSEGLYRISAVATLSRRAKTVVTKRPAQPRPRYGGGGGGGGGTGGGGTGRFRVGRAPAKKAAKKSPARKAAKKSAPEPRRIHGREPLSLGFSDLEKRQAVPTKAEEVKEFETVDVFYATDREQKTGSDASGVVTFLNQLPDKASLNYGICSVTVPANHKLGKIETPSFWTLKINKAKHFTISACSPRPKAQFFKDLCDRIVRSDEQSCFVFIHGYNVSFEDAAMRTAQLAKDLNFKGVPMLYSWASAYKLNRYEQDTETVGMTIKRLRLFLEQLIETKCIHEIHLIAHSMGNRALIAALDLLSLPGDALEKPFEQIVLTAPDVPRKDVESLIEATSRRAERVTLYASRKDKALGISKAKNKYERLGKVYGYPYVFPGMDSIDASEVRTDFLAHTVFAKTRTVLSDLQALIQYGAPPDKRFGLKQLKSPEGICWKFAP